MRVAQRLDYALRAVVLLAARPPGVFVPGSEIAAGLALPQRVVEQQLSTLAAAGLLRSRRGAGGGHSLARDASGITVFDVVRGLQGYTLDVPHVTGSVASEVWQDAVLVLERHFADVTIASLVVRQRQLESSAAGSYVI